MGYPVKKAWAIKLAADDKPSRFLCSASPDSWGTIEVCMLFESQELAAAYADSVAANGPVYIVSVWVRRSRHVISSRSKDERVTVLAPLTTAATTSAHRMGWVISGKYGEGAGLYYSQSSPARWDILRHAMVFDSSASAVAYANLLLPGMRLVVEPEWFKPGTRFWHVEQGHLSSEVPNPQQVPKESLTVTWQDPPDGTGNGRAPATTDKCYQPPRRMTRDAALAAGYTVDDALYPHLGYKGPRFAPTEKVEVMTDLEAQLTTQVVVLETRISMLKGHYQDVYRTIAAASLKCRPEEVTDDQRDMVKRILHLAGWLPPDEAVRKVLLEEGLSK